MRSDAEILKPVISALKAASNLKQSQLRALCEVEIGLYLQHKLMIGAPAAEAWTLFSGYAFAQEWGAVTAAEDIELLRVARYSVWTFRRRTAWLEALKRYQKLDRPLRGFDVPDPAGAAAMNSNVSLAGGRWNEYDQLLDNAPPFVKTPLHIAGSGPHRFPVGRSTVTVDLPKLPTLTAPSSHDINRIPARGGAPLTVRWADLVQTAVEMDATLDMKWEKRLRDTRLFTPSGDSFAPADELTVSRLLHLLGIVGAGKSTLRDVLAVHLAKRRQTVTVVVGDVAELLRLVALYNTYVDSSAAPILGASGRQRHAQRLHRRLAGRGKHNLLAHDDPGFDHLSTSCVLNTLLPAHEDLLPFSAAPCGKLQSRHRDAGEPGYEGPEWNDRRLACPFWSACPRHHSARALVDALIWVATPASLVDSEVPRPQSGGRIRYLELACRRSDLIIVDEADRVQMQLDRMFAPAVPLVSGSEAPSLLDDVNTHRIRELAQGGRTQLSDHDVENWTAAVNTVTAATDRLYAMLVGDHELRTWVKIGYFSAWSLQLRLADDRYSDDKLADPAVRTARTELTDLLDRFRDNPFGDRISDPVPELTSLISELLTTSYQDRTRDRLTQLMTKLFDLNPVIIERWRAYAIAEKRKTQPAKKKPKPEPHPDEWLAEMTRRFEFTLLLSALESKLSLMNAMWPRVESVLKLGFNDMYRVPSEYGPVVPEAPMGNVLGFQFLVNGPDTGGVRTGELRYFRCGGVGRELLRVMPGLPEVDGHPNTNVLLMSGSSWAGKSSRYHLPVPVGAIIEPQPEEIDEIADHSELRIEFLQFNGKALQVSGSRLDDRPEILRRMAIRLGESIDDEPSLLEKELSALTEDRRHILLLVGSYEEAALVADTLHTLRRRWRGSVARLVADDDDVEVSAAGVHGNEQHARILRRGDVENLATTPAEILVAPLLAVERGHNILNDNKVAAIGTAYFLARPNPRPDDIGLAVHAINDWIVRSIDSGEFGEWVRGADSLDASALAVRKQARSQWYRVLARTMAWSRLGADREAVTWDLLVLIWQVIGRLVRGSVRARVVFVDAAFAPKLAGEPPQADTNESSLLYSMRSVLQPYFSADPAITPAELHIVTALYRPLWSALGKCLEQAEERIPPCIP